MTGIDAATSYAWAKIFDDKSTAAATDFLNHILNRSNSVTITNVLTDNGLEFTTHWPSKKHRFEDARKEYNINHRYTKVRHPWTNGFVERLNRTINEEFYQVAFRKTAYLSIQQLQDDLDQFINFYNRDRPHQGYRLNGKSPDELFLYPREQAAV